MDSHFTRLESAQKKLGGEKHIFTAHGEMLLRMSCDYTGRNKVRMSSNTQARVTQIHDKASVLVDLEKRTCTCYRL
jgi:hypothetical protein